MNSQIQHTVRTLPTNCSEAPHPNAALARFHPTASSKRSRRPIVNTMILCFNPKVPRSEISWTILGNYILKKYTRNAAAATLTTAAPALA